MEEEVRKWIFGSRNAAASSSSSSSEQPSQAQIPTDAEVSPDVTSGPKSVRGPDESLTNSTSNLSIASPRKSARSSIVIHDSC